MTTYNRISDTEFSITFVTDKFNSPINVFSDPVTHSELQWSICVLTTEVNELNAFLYCHGNNSNAWSTTANVTVYMRRNEDKEKMIIFDRSYNSDVKSWGFSTFKNVAQLLNGFIQNGKIEIEFIVKIQSIAGNHPIKRHNFHHNNSELSDVVLMVEDKPLYVSKHMLSYSSPVFHAMFYSNFKEKNQNCIELNDLILTEFEEFLQLLHHCSVEIKETNVGSLLMLADRFDTPLIKNQCELFLLSTRHVTNEEKLNYAEKYLLQGLQLKCIDSIETLPAYEAMCVDVEKRDKTTMVGLIRKAIGMMRKMTTTTTTTS